MADHEDPAATQSRPGQHDKASDRSIGWRDWVVAVVPLVVGVCWILILWQPMLEATVEQATGDPAADTISQLARQQRVTPTASEAATEAEGEDQDQRVTPTASEAATEAEGEDQDEGGTEEAGAEQRPSGTPSPTLQSSIEDVAVAAAQVKPLNRQGVLFGFVVHAEVLFMLVSLAGGIAGGALMTTIRLGGGSVEDHRWLYVRWLVGGSLALFVYFLIRGGLLNFAAGAAALSADAVVGLSAIVGMFSENMARMLGNVMNAIFPGGDGSDSPN